MNDSTISLPWLVIRQDDNGNRYSVGRYATRAEAQGIADTLDSRGHKQLYWVERIGPGQGETQAQAQAQAQAQHGDGTRN